MFIDLTDKWEEIKAHARSRNSFKENNHVVSKKYNTKKTDEEINFDGLKGEYAVANFLGLEVNKEITFVGDGGSDLEYKDKTIQVKYNNYRCGEGDLYFDNVPNSTYIFKTDVAFLVVPTKELKVVNIVGWITREEFNKKCYIRNFGYGERKVVDQWDLTPTKAFLLRRNTWEGKKTLTIRRENENTKSCL